MTKIYTQTIKRFDGGIASDLRTEQSGKAGNIQHFDVYPTELRPFRSTEADEAHSGGSPADKAGDMVKFVYAPKGASDYNLYGFGVSTGAVAQFYEKNTAGDVTSVWSIGVGAAGSGSRNELVCAYYKNYIYYWEAGARLARFGPLSGSRQIATYQTIAYTNVAEPVHHSADDIIYFFHDNIVAKLDDTTFTDTVLTLPDNLKIVSATAFGNYLAIGCAPEDGDDAITDSVVYLWDRDSSFETISQQIFLGKGALKHLGNVDGTLRCVIDYFTRSAFGLDGAKVIAKAIIGNQAITTHELEVTTISAATFPADCNKMETGSELLWAMKLVRGNDTISGIWSLDKNGAMYCTHIEEDADADGIQGFYKLGNYWFIAHSNDGSVNRSDDNANYTFDSIYETPIFRGNEDHWHKKKQLVGVTVYTKAQPTAGTTTAKYRKDEETTYSTIGSNSTDNDTRHRFHLANGNKFPTFIEQQLRVESTGGTVITGLAYSYEVIEDSPY